MLGNAMVRNMRLPNDASFSVVFTGKVRKGIVVSDADGLPNFNLQYKVDRFGRCN